MAIPRHILAQVAAAGKKKPPKRLPRSPYPLAQERELGKAIASAFRAWFKAEREAVLAELPRMAQGVHGARLDTLEDVRAFFELARGRWRSVATRLGKITDGLLDEIAAFNLRGVRRQLEAGLGVAPLVGEPWLQDETRARAAEVARLVVGIGEDAAADLERIVTDGVRGGDSTATIAEAIDARLGVGERRAFNIARDQAASWNGRLTRIRHQAVGVDRYRWRNSQDRRVRGRPDGLYPNARYSHWSREGREFAYDEPPPDGNPGQPILCRCTPEPVLDDFFEGLDEFQGPAGALGPTL